MRLSQLSVICGLNGWKALAGQRSRRRRSGNASTAGMGLEVQCHRCETRASIHLMRSTGRADLEIGGIAEVPLLLQERILRAAGT